ncbi:hypothetical protein F4820DRAFT_320078 [Hypoxylon rubiginosum]|uniref:Uncharacterized protein n=1 Tax=Hypoxylon rubiginosum TaxID=110542 RepID=A0ACB9ZFR5_9PEZI|nr:hypothetical protein F4820DRAFT_320078 [Hypoxylon rubiginosum]
MLSPRTLLAGVAGLLAAASLAAASPQGPIKPVSSIPAHCFTTSDDWEHTTATVKTHECYTYTREAPSPNCPIPSCPPRVTDAICPQIIEVSSVTVPCATDCCPTTTTSYVSTAACPTCAGNCPVPTQWITYTTGCAGTPTITSQTIVTPP